MAHRITVWKNDLCCVASVGICASDLKCYSGAPLLWGDSKRVGFCQPPVIPGHKFVGEVVALGEGAGQKYGLQLGDTAVSEQIVLCWQCRFCKRGHPRRRRSRLVRRRKERRRSH